MNYAKIEKRDRASGRRMFFLSCLLHALLLGGIYYLNTDNPTEIIPDFVTEWFDKTTDKEIATIQKNTP